MTPRQVTDAIIAAIARDYGVTFADLMGQRKTKAIAKARQRAMWTLRQLKKPDGTRRLSLPQVGRKFSGRHHTTALHAEQVMRAELSARAAEQARAA